MKKFISIILTMAMLLSMTTLVSFADDATTNVLVGGTATGSQAQYAASFAVDGIEVISGNNYWRTYTGQTSHTLTIALSEAKTFDKVSVIMAGSFGGWWSSGTITVLSADNENFTGAQTLTTIDMTGAASYSAVFAATTAQYVRFTFTTTEDTTGYSKGLGVLEVGAYNSGEGPAVDPSTKINVFEGATAYAESAKYAASFAVDGVTAPSGNDYWRTYTNRSSYSIDLTLTEEKTFDKADVYIVSQFMSNKWDVGSKIYVKTSKDDSFTTLKTVVVADMNKALQYTLTFPAVTTKYVRITFENTAANELGIAEICGYNSGEGFKTENNVSVHDDYIITECTLSEGTLTMKAMATNYTAAKTFTAIVANYSGTDLSQLTSIDVLDSQTVNFNELTDITFEVGSLSGNYKIFVWENLAGSKPVLEYK